MTYGKDVDKIQNSVEVFQSVDSCIPQKPNLEDFWNVEAIGVMDNPKSSDDEKALETFRETLKFEDGRYQVKWPWKDDNPELPHNRELAMGRLRSFVRRMKSNPELLKKYDLVIQDQLDKGIIEKAVTNDWPKHYIPHHAVIKPGSSTTKLRVVYDASAKSKYENKSLNECLRRGPVMLKDLCGMPLRFRLKRVALVSDIEKAFLQIGLQPSERDVTRFLWLKNVEDTTTDPHNIEEYRFCRVPFGIISSPFLLSATVDTHLESFKSDIANQLRDDIYVDNVITGTNSDSEAITLYREAKAMFKSASMNLREWLCNSKRVNAIIPTEDKAKDATMKVLGHIWDSVSDMLSIQKTNAPFKDKELTKRNMLTTIASVFDPMGLFAPVVLRGKVLLQEIWKLNYDWDDIVTNEEVVERWSKVYPELEKLPEVSIQRYLNIKSTENSEYALLCFCDASKSSYSATVYLHEVCDKTATTHFLFAKTRLAPVKELTIPRLELMAVLIGVRCISFVKGQLKIPIQEQFLWTDSQCVLGWIRSCNKQPVFVENRLKEIKAHEEVSIHYINTKENPADVATRGTTVEDLYKNTLWWHGPEWLSDPAQSWKDKLENTKLFGDYKEQTAVEDVSMKATAPATVETVHVTPFGISEEKYSSATKLLRVTAYAIRFVKKMLKQSSITGSLTSTELEESERLWILYVQKKNYGEVMDGMIKDKPTNIQIQLGIVFDERNILRCRGRLENSSLSEGSRFPVLLPPTETFTRLLVERSHRQNLHSGVSQTLALLRYHYWIPHGRASVRSVIRGCNVCRKFEGGPYKMPPMPALPKIRVSEACPFSQTGLDYMGPLQIKIADGAKKVWICLFTCLVTRAVHLELIQDMSAEEFLLCLKRFISQRGTPAHIISDNAAQFKAASEAINSVWKRVIHSDDVQSYSSSNGIKWSFIVELAPWMGGFYERLVGIVKRSLRKTICRKLLL